MTQTKYEREISNATTKKWLALYGQVNDQMEADGFPRFAGTPVGHLMNIDAISSAASRFADECRAKHKAKDGSLPDVEYYLHLRGEKIMADCYVRTA